ncbi:hypothetical protein Mapa_006949 [Marchantia paleacea]|nr:hypothetical protein Mapa_006949 [Marchantia paleacea]
MKADGAAVQRIGHVTCEPIHHASDFCRREVTRITWTQDMKSSSIIHINAVVNYAIGR